MQKLQTSSLKSPPMDLEAEAAVIGACLLYADVVVEVVEKLQESHFYARSNGLVFSAIRAMFEAGKAIDSVTVMHELRSMGVLDEAGGSAHIAQLTTPRHLGVAHPPTLTSSPARPRPER